MFSLTEDYKGKSLAIFYANGDSETIPETHVSFQAILDRLLSGQSTDEKIRELTEVLQTVARKMSALSERVSVDGTEVYFDGDPLAGELSEVIKSLFANGNTDFKPLVNFLEKAKQNPSMKSVDDLYRWIKNGDLVIDPDGDIIAYKGVKVNSKGVSESIHAGSAFVNGVEVSGYIPNVPGSVISMPRSEVDPESQHYCSTGLHAGTYSYASSFAQGRLILVKFNPRDVVSCPTDSADQKLRVSRYVVLTEIEARLQSSVYQPSLPIDESDEDYFDDDDYDYEEDLFEDDEDEDEDYLGSEELADWEKELLGIPVDAPEEAVEAPETEEEPEEELSLTDELREALERFKARTDVPAKRDSNGRFIL
jgi:hypothetical protein